MMLVTNREINAERIKKELLWLGFGQKHRSAFMSTVAETRVANSQTKNPMQGFPGDY